MIKLSYVLVAIVVLLPSFVAGVMTLYAVRATHQIAREAPRDRSTPHYSQLMSQIPVLG